MSLEKGTLLNNMYRVVNILGKGGMGNVYLVERKKDDTRFVVKELVITEGLELHNAREIFFREAEFMAKFNHEGLPGIHGVFTQNGSEYITMDYIEGETLEEIINTSSGPLSEDKAIRWAIEIAEIIDYLHNSFHAPIVYRDLKPSNIIITPKGRVKLVDFGIARYYNPDKTSDTFRFGSPGYAAPEQYKGRGQSGPQADVYGLGVILFQMLTKYDPTVKLFHFPSLTSLNPSLSEELEGIVNRAIQLDPLKRYISMDEFKVKLSKYLGIDGKKIFSEPVLSNNIFGMAGITLGFATIIISVIFIIARVYDIFIDESIMENIAITGFIAYAAAIMLSIAGMILPLVNRERSFSPTGSAILLNGIILILFFILGPNFLRFRPSGGQCSACQSNLKNLATSLEMYCTDYEGRYPPYLSYLTMNYPGGSYSYMKVIPACPSSRKKDTYSYIVAIRPDNFTIWCNYKGAHISAGYPNDECWPQYSSSQGLMLPKTKW